MRRSTVSKSSVDRNFAPLGANEPKVGETADRFVGELSGTIAGRAGVVELAYTPALGAGARESMRVRVPPPAPMRWQRFSS